MQAISLNFVQRRRLASPLGLLLFVAGLMAVGMVAFDFYGAQEELTRVEARQARLPRPDAVKPVRVSALPALADDAKLVVRVVAQLRQPWDTVLHEIDMLADPAVALLSIEAQGQTRTLHLTGEVKTMAALVAYVGRLRASPSIDTAYLSHHEDRQVGAVKVIRFAVDATWRAPL